MARVLLVRHGETAWNRERRIQGWAPTNLTDRGRDQAATLADALEHAYEITRIHASDLPRTQETAGILTPALDAPLTLDPRWRERDFGFCQGLPYDDFTDTFPDLSLAAAGEPAVRTTPESGESLQATRDRVLAAWHDLTDTTTPDETVLVVTHGGPICLLLGHLDNRPIVQSFLDYRQDNCAINEVTLDNPPRIVRENHTPTD